MEALILTLFISLVLVGLAVLLLVRAVNGGDIDHGDRLSLLPLEDEASVEPAPAASSTVEERTV